MAEIIQRTRPDIVLLNEFDWDPDGEAARLFQERYLARGQHASGADPAAEPIDYPYRFTAPVNTGVASGFDLDNDGAVGQSGRAYGADALGFGMFPGQYGMVLFSRFPIEEAEVRTFQRFRWRDLPNARLPTDSVGAPWYTEQELDALPLSSKSHWDIPVRVGDTVVHILASHPTPPVFDGPEDRNGLRNYDEIRFWSLYLSRAGSGPLYDDDGTHGGLPAGAHFVVVGDMNADPFDGDSFASSIRLLLEYPAVHPAITPSSPGGTEQAALQGGVNAAHRGDPAFDTADFADGGGPGSPGNLRLDYVLPSRTLRSIDAGVFWPRRDEVLFALVGTFPFPASDHRLVWIDLAVPSPSTSPPMR